MITKKIINRLGVSRIIQRLVVLYAPAFVAVFAEISVAADVFHLASGATITGQWLNREQIPRQNYEIRLENGVEISLPKESVREVKTIRDEKLEYERIRPGYPDTVEGHWQLANWCREKNLLSEREVHLRRILELDPNHQEARRLLGYMHVEGEWTTREELMKADGYVLFGGRWMLPQAVRLLEQEKKIKAAQGEWKQKLNRWQSWLDSSRVGLAKEQLQQINDPFAVEALLDALKSERRDWVRILYIDALARIGTVRAQQALAQWSLADPVEEVRLSCLDHLKQKRNPAVVDFFIGKLRSSDNVEVNRAAVALRHLGDRSAIGPLIEALVTTHRFKIQEGNPGQITTSFGTGGTGLSMGGGTKIVTRSFQNREVLDALVALTGGTNFSFDVPRWRAWYASQRRAEMTLNPRRD